jgi:predicted transcriptional regulator
MKRSTISRRDSKKNKLLKYIANSPGIRYRELSRASGFPNGVMAYHLKILEISKRIRVTRYYKKTTRYYPLNISPRESRIIEFVKRSTDRKIILFLLQHDRCLYIDIMRNIKRASSTVSYHLSSLREAGIISTRQHTYRSIRQHTYSLRNRHLVIRAMKKVKEA